MRLTADHAKAVEDPTMVPMDFEGSFVRHLADVAGDRRNFDGLYGEAETMSDHKHVAVHQVRWQGMSGELLEEELIALSAQEGVMREMPHEDFSKLLLHPLQSCEPSSATDNHRQVAKELAASIDRLLARRLANGRMPTSVFVTAAIQLTGSE